MENVQGMSGIQLMGVVGALKTGNVVLDMIIAMCIPLLFQFLFGFLNKLHMRISVIDWLSFLWKRGRIHERFIRHSTLKSSNGCSVDLGGGDSQNEVLIKAIQLYLDFHGLLKLNAAELELKSFQEEEKRVDDYYYYENDGNDKSKTIADTLSEYRVVKKPMKREWVSLGKFSDGKGGDLREVELMIHEEKEDVGNNNDRNSTASQKLELSLHFRSEGKQSIDNFVDKAYQWYLDELRKMEDNSRYMYELVVKSETNNHETNQTYKRYKLSDEKTFDSLFFQEKEKVLNVVNHFENKTGKFAIKGFPHKLGLLLHGPPGTGKTSLIKALAQHTKRSIVNVPLARIATNAELSSIFFDQKYHLDGEKVPVNLGFEDVIFVMEDIDAASKIVRRRDGKKTAEVTCTKQVDVPITKSLWKMILESNNGSCEQLAKLLMEKSERLKTAAHEPAMLSCMAQRMATVPGLSLIGEDSNDDVAQKIAKEAVQSAQDAMNDYRVADEFLGTHAQTLLQMLDTGAEVTKEFEDELLSFPLCDASGLGAFVSLSQPSMSREVSLKQYADDSDVHVETADKIMKSAVAELLDKQETNDETEKSDLKEKCIGIGPSLPWKSKKDALNLTGILNVLDGVVDTPGRMLIITSNHPESLDPALVRPGRIDKKLMLGYMASGDLVTMVEHYFQCTLDKKQTTRLKAAIDGDTNLSSAKPHPHLKLTPAQVEQLASEIDDVEEFITAVEKKSSMVPKKANATTHIVYNT